MNEPSSKTRLSLVVRLKNAQDHEAWDEFTAIYEPLLLRLLQLHGLQESDARDVCQQVLTAVARDIEQWRPDGGQRSFRRWLFRIAKNRALKFLSQERKRPRAAGGSEVQAAMEQHRDQRESLTELFEREYRQQLLVQAAAQIRAEFRESTWLAFWGTYIEGRPIAEVAQELELSQGSVYVARSRIVARLKSKVQEIVDHEE